MVMEEWLEEELGEGEEVEIICEKLTIDCTVQMLLKEMTEQKKTQKNKNKKKKRGMEFPSILWDRINTFV